MGIPQESRFHVLAVDDSLIDRKLIEQLLRTSSYQVTAVDSGSKALEFLGFREDRAHGDLDKPTISSNKQQEVEVNLIITDYCMPGMTGYDLLKKIKESSALRNIPVVIMSSENVPARITECLEEGAEEFFLKPVRLSDLHKLRPLMKSKVRKDGGEDDHQQQQQQDDEDEDEDAEEENHQTQQQQQQQQSDSNSSNKRKATSSNTVEESFSPDRTRPRYGGFATIT